MLNHPHVSALWGCRDWLQFLETDGLRCTQVGCKGEFWCVHNLQRELACDFLALDVKGLNTEVIQACVESIILPQVVVVGTDQFPTLPEDRANWLYNQLVTSTRGYSHGAVASAAAKQISAWLEQMTPGHEAEHLESLYRF